MIPYTKIYSPPEVNKKEILRYAGVSHPTEEIHSLMTDCLELSLDSLSYKVCYIELPIKHYPDKIDLGFATSTSHSLIKNLDGCQSIVLFAATVGNALDRLIARYSSISPSKAFMLQAIGAERIEALCNSFNKEISESAQKNGKLTVARFSAGYGDFALELQKDIFRVLDCQRKIGLTLNESLLMSPSKSVTALIGIKNQEIDDEHKGISQQ